MTTIAYKNGIIAYDSRATNGAVITNPNANKCKTLNGASFFFCGAISDFDDFMALYFGEPVDKTLDVTAIVVEGSSVTLASSDEEGKLWKENLLEFPCYAIGSGATFALTAMDMGADAKKAVAMAAKRDTGTGGTIRTYKVQQQTKKKK